jgi:hypothetical protein
MISIAILAVPGWLRLRLVTLVRLIAVVRRRR